MNLSTRLFTLTLALLSGTTFAEAQADTAHHRKVYTGINADKSLAKIKATHTDEPTVFALTGWLDGSEIRKIVAVCGDDGEGSTEYYLENEKPLFVYNTYLTGAEGSKNRPRVEERVYFKDGEVFKMLTTDQPAPTYHAEDFEATKELYTSNCKAFLTALKKTSPTSRPKTVATKTAEGQFLGIEQGDYFHWRMQTAGGEEVSYFVLKPDNSVEKVLENPDAFVGKRCRIVWKKSTENIPESGGDMEVEQMVSVEWVAPR